MNSKIERDRQLINDAKAKGTGAKLLAYTKLSGPGWLQSAITLGGGSLAGSLFLGTIGGYEMMWLQPVMMIFGVVMLSAIGYVALSTNKSPFQQINEHINPVLGWGWAIATLMANLVWAMPQFSLGTAAMQQNLGIVPPGIDGEWIAVGVLFGIGTIVVLFYDSGGWGIKLFEWVLKIMVGVVVLSFFAVVIAMSLKGDGLDWGAIIAGFVPNPSLLNQPSGSMQALIDQSTHAEYWKEQVVSAQRDRMVAAAATAVGINMTFLLPYSMLKRGWDRDFRGLAAFDLSTGLFIPFLLATSCVVIAAASQFHGEPEEGLLDLKTRTANTAKIDGPFKANLDGLLKASEAKRWQEAFLEQHGAMNTDGFKAAFEAKLTEHKWPAEKIKAALNTSSAKPLSDLAAAEAGKWYDGLVAQQAEHDGVVAKERAKHVADKSENSVKTMEKEDATFGLGLGALDQARDGLKDSDKRIAATLIKRDAFALANSLEKLAGKGIAQYVFGIGVVGMAISTIIILMLINGFTICEMLGRPSRGWLHRFGCLLPGISGALGFMYLWKGSAFYLAVPTSRFGMVLLPIAYVAFFVMMNSKKILGDQRPRGIKRIVINLLMLVGVGLALVGAGTSIFNDKAMLNVRVRDLAIALLAMLFVLGLFVACGRNRSSDDEVVPTASEPGEA